MIESAQACARLRASGLRLTPQRRAVIDALVGDASHPTADEVASRLAERVPGISLSTVYKVLHELSELGLVRELAMQGATRFDPAEEDHIHVSCGRCGAVHDAPLQTETYESITAAVCVIGDDVRSVDVVVRATCHACSDKSSIGLPLGRP